MESRGLESFYRASRSLKLSTCSHFDHFGLGDSLLHSDKIACFHLPTKADANMKYFILNRERGYVKRGISFEIIDKF